jgi:hypothetical protein
MRNSPFGQLSVRLTVFGARPAQGALKHKGRARTSAENPL